MAIGSTDYSSTRTASMRRSWPGMTHSPVQIHRYPSGRLGGYRLAKAAWLKIQEVDPSACIHRLLALEGAIEGVKKTGLPDAVKADLKAFYQAHKLKKRSAEKWEKRFPFAPQHIQYTIFAIQCLFSVSPTFVAHSCVSSHLAK